MSEKTFVGVPTIPQPESPLTGHLMAPLIAIQCDLTSAAGLQQNFKTIHLPAVPGSTELVMIGTESFICRGRRFVVNPPPRSDGRVCILLERMVSGAPLVRAPAGILNGAKPRN